MPREGYKRTELGVLPDEWEIKPIEFFLDRIIDYRGKTPLKADCGIPLLTAKNVREGYLVEEPKEFIDVKDYETWMTRGIPEPGDVMFTTEAPLGNVAFVPSEKIALAQRIIVLCPNKQKLHNKFLLYALMFPQNKHRLELKSTGSTVLGVKQSEFRKLEFATPPLPEQRCIAEILSTVDETIEHTEALIEKYKNIKKGLMADLLTRGIDEKGRIRSEETHRFKDSPLGRIPEEWEIDVLSNLTNKIIDGTHYTPNYTDYGVPFLRVTDIQNKTINFKQLKFISPNEHMELIKRCRPEKDDILYSKNGTIGIRKIIDWDWEFSIFVSLCLIKTKPDKIRTEYLFYILGSDIIKKQIRIRTKQMTVMNLHLEEIKEFQIPKPSQKEQYLIAELLKVADERIEKEQAYLNKLQQIKKGLMQDLLTGRVRVRVPQEAEA